jgi:excinuclease UvrABC nuclease subunit
LTYFKNNGRIADVMKDFLKTVTWARAENLRGAALTAPPLPGVYAFGLVQASHRLPIGVEWVYVGRATNLRQRLSQHVPLLERNIALRDWITSGRRVEVWYSLLPTEQLATMEIGLIRELQPKFNRIRYSRVTNLDRRKK